MEPESRAGGDANPVSRDHAEHHGAGGEARAIDDDLLAGTAQKREVFEIRPDLASRIRLDSHGRRRIRDRQRRNHGAQKRSNPHESPLSPVLCPRGASTEPTPRAVPLRTLNFDLIVEGDPIAKKPGRPETAKAPQ